MPQQSDNQATIAGIKQLLLSGLMLLIQATAFFVSAGHISGLRPWIYFSSAFAHYSVSTAIQWKFSPELLAQRLRRKREGSKLWDEILMRVSNLMVIIIIPTVAGLDVGRFYWSSIDVSFSIVGFILMFVSTILLNWAMIVNPYFEPTVRIQRERGHMVITRGPYRILRHPGYLAAILFALSIPILIGSAFAFVPAIVYVLLMIVRTELEDKTLRRELSGYSDYAHQTRYRLFPGVW